MIDEAKEYREEFVKLQSDMRADFAEIIIRVTELGQKIKTNLKTD